MSICRMNMLSQIPKIAAIFLILTLIQAECKNVVFLPLMITSHARLHGLVAEELTKMGHNTWLALPSALEKRKTDTFPGVKTFSYNDFWEESEDQIVTDLENTVIQAINTGNEPDWNWVWESMDTISEMYYQAMKEGKFTQYIENIQPDLIVLDWNPYVDERVALPYKMKVPFAVLSALQDPISGKIPFSPYAEAYNSLQFQNDASFFQQIQTVINIMKPLFFHLFNDRGYMKRLFPDDANVPAANELMASAEVFIVESDTVFDYPRPMLPNVKLVGGVSAGPAKALQEPFKSFLERSEKAGVGVAVFSFGSLFMNIPKKVETKLLSVLKRLKLNTIWRANITSPDPNKILTSTWIPQNDLLGNKNVKVYLTHSGVHSLYEGIYHGVPMVCLPLFFDQVFNMERAIDKGYCLGTDFLKATEDELVKIIEEAATSTQIRTTIGKASEIYRELYKNPKHEAAYWLDHVMRHGGSYMRYSGQKIPMYLFIMDYILVFLAGILVTITFLFIILILKKIFSFCCRKKGHLKKD